ncbi:TorD/DmsD family molecular chaperone [Rubneribacter sp.]
MAERSGAFAGAATGGHAPGADASAAVGADAGAMPTAHADAASNVRAVGALPADAGAALGALARTAARLVRFPFGDGMIAFFCGLDADDAGDFVMGDSQCREGALMIKRFFLEGDRAARVRQASDDFHKLFVGPSKLLAAPWSSVYLDLGSLFGPTALAVEREFKRHGFAIPEGNREPCDHMAYELEFLAELHQAAEDARVRGDEAAAQAAYAEARAFKERFIDPWSDAFLGAVEAGARVDAYRGVALLVRGFLALEGAFLRVVDGEPGR